MGCDDRESPSIGANQRRRDVQANADSLTPHRIDSESTGAIASAPLGRALNRSSAGAGKPAGVAEMAATTADQVGA